MTHSIKQFLAWIGFFGMLLAFPMCSYAQITCVPLGSIVECSGPYGQSQTQVPLGPNAGVIITDHDTMPYTFLGQPAQPRAFDPTPLPTTPRASTMYTPGAESNPYGYSSPSMGAYGAQYGIILGQ